MIRIGFILLFSIIFIHPAPGPIKSAAFADDVPKFTDVKGESGLKLFGTLGQTAVWGDYNADGRLDLLVSILDTGSRRGIRRNMRDRSPETLKEESTKKAETVNRRLYLFAGTDGNKFKPVAHLSGLPDLNVMAASWADYNNDGFLDLAIGTIRAGKPPLLYKNVDGTAFVDVSESSGITKGDSTVRHIVWADFDRDGRVDLFQAGLGNSYLYRNQGDGGFKEVSDAAGIGMHKGALGAVWFDANNDGYQDLFLVNSGLNTFYLNNGDGTFADKTEHSGLGGESAWKTNAACPGDYNGDGYLDLYVTNIGKARRNALYKNNRDGTFTDVTPETKTEDVGDGRTCAWVDFDADGRIDLFTTNHVKPTKLYRNLGDGVFADVAPDSGVDSPIDVFAATWGDYDRDGYIDVFLNGHAGGFLMKNGGNSNNSVTIGLVGDGLLSNRSAIGARVGVSTPEGVQIREVSGGRGCCEQDMLSLYFGVGKEKVVDIDVEWPSGKVCSFDNIPVDKNKEFAIHEIKCEINKLN